MQFLTEFYPILAWTLAVALVVQVYKKVLKIAGVRTHGFVESTLPLVPVVLGAVSGAVFSDLVGLQAVTTGTDAGVPWTLALFYGAGVGAVSGHVYRTVVAMLPEDSKIRGYLNVSD